MEFEWDSRKALQNIEKHAISFEEATDVFDDDLSSTTADPDHSSSEDRFLIFGLSKQQNHLDQLKRPPGSAGEAAEV